MKASWWKRLGIALILAPIALCGCVSLSVPSQSNPSCSWTSQLPNNADAVCLRTFHTLRSVLQSAIRGDDARLRVLVPDAVIRHRIAAFGASVRHQGDISVHITPSFTLSTLPGGRLGAEFNIVGHTRHGDVKAPQTVYLARRGGITVIIQDQPMQEW